MSSTTAETHLDFLSLLLKLWRWKWILLACAVGCAGLALAFSLAQAPLHQSFAVVFPAKGESRDAMLDGPDFGYDIHAERLIQMLDSEAMRDSLIRRFGLLQHYGVDPTDPNWRDEFQQQYFKRVKLNKTLYSSVIIIVHDTDPQLAADMANYMAETVNEIHAGLVRRTTEDGIQKLEAAIREKERDVKAIQDTLGVIKVSSLSVATGTLEGNVAERSAKRTEVLRRLDDLQRKHNIVHMDEQLGVYHQQLAEARSQQLESSGKVQSLSKEKPSASSDSLLRIFRAEGEGASQRVAYYERQIADLMAVYAEYSTLRQRLQTENELLSASENAVNNLKGQFEPEFKTTQLMVSEQDLLWELDQLNALRAKYEVARVSLLDPTPAAYMVSPAWPNPKAVSPTTLLNVVLGFCFGLFSCTIFLLLAERLRERLRKPSPTT